MKNLSYLLFLFPVLCFSQIDLSPILTTGLEDANKFTSSYLEPGLDAVAFNLSNGWYSSAKAKGLGSFEIAIIGNASFVSEDQQSFELNTNEYDFLEFSDGSSAKNVANVLGENDPSITALSVYTDEFGNEQTVSFELPDGLSGSGLNFVPTAALQANVGLVFGFEAVVRALPEVKSENNKFRFYGFGLKNEFTKWIPGTKALPISIAGMINYSKFDARFALEETVLINGNDQRIDLGLETWAIDLIVSTRLPVINFYAGGGYVMANSTYGLNGTYQINDGPNSGETIVDPISNSSSLNGYRATLGTRLSLGIFKLFADYSFQEFSTVSVGIGFGI
ncbi:MAG: DUF6588 family protein [Psychroflexus maritimus]